MEIWIIFFYNEQGVMFHRAEVLGTPSLDERRNIIGCRSPSNQLPIMFALGDRHTAILAQAQSSVHVPTNHAPLRAV